MAGIFISHSSKNNLEAERLRSWLENQGWGRSQVFLDLRDLKSGDRWRDVLNGMNDSEAVIVCLSDEWLSSDECKREFTQAEERGKVLLPITVAPITLPLPRFITDLQIGDLSSDGVSKLRDQLLAKRITPESFPWPPPGDPHRAVYRGLESLDVPDAAIFFGRDADILRALDELRSLRTSGKLGLFVVLGASGAGKSSFMRAGLVARLRRDEQNFLVLPVIRPEHAAISATHGLAASLSAALVGPPLLHDGKHLAEAFSAIRAPVVSRLARASGDSHTTNVKQPTIVLAIDQAEELFNAENEEASFFMQLIQDAADIDGNILIVATIRSDSYEAMQTKWMPARHTVFSLPSIPAGLFQEIIEGPAKLSTPPLSVEPALTQRLLRDLDAADALPLLAFTMEQLHSRFGRDGKLTLDDYVKHLGGLPGAIQSAADGALGALPDSDTLARARRLFIPALVTVHQGVVQRRIARRADVPSDLNDLCDRLIASRLLVSEGDFVEVAHEAILRQWAILAAWIDGERSALETVETLRAAAHEWGQQEGVSTQEEWIVHQGDRLTAAVALSTRAEFSTLIGTRERAYLDACESAEVLRREEEAFERLRRAELLRFTDTYLQSEERNFKRLSSKLYMGMWSRDGLELVQTLRGASRRWHPKPAVYVEGLGIDHHGGDKDRYCFPCCDLNVVVGDAPSQFRSDGCAEAAERKAAKGSHVSTCSVGASLWPLLEAELPNFDNPIFRERWSTSNEHLQIVYLQRNHLNPDKEEALVRQLEANGMSKRAIHLVELIQLASPPPEPDVSPASMPDPAMVSHLSQTPRTRTAAPSKRAGISFGLVIGFIVGAAVATVGAVSYFGGFPIFD